MKSLHGEQQPDNSGPLSSATSSTKDGYPKRSPVFALKAIRLMGKVVVCQEIGTTAFALLATIVATEDAARYRRAVTFYDCQLMMQLGLSKNALSRARQKAIEAGWLHYQPGRKGVAGSYWLTVPITAVGIDDLPSDEGEESELLFQNGTESEPESDTASGTKAGRIRDESGTKAGSFQPNPKPNPKPNPDPNPPLPPKGEQDGLEIEFINSWNTCQGVRRIQGESLTPKRRRAFKSRISDVSWNWKAAIAKFPLKVTASDPDGWKPDVDWFLRPDSVQSILEGKYDWSKQNGNGKSHNVIGDGQRYNPATAGTENRW